MQQQVRDVQATVRFVIAEYEQALVETADGYEFAITPHTTGVQWHELRAGQRLLCTVTVTLPRVLSARIIG